jgi:hypothetical protein
VIAIAVLTEEHTAIEAALDRLAESLAAGQFDAAIFDRVTELIAAHYVREEEFLAELHAHEPNLAAKLREQHEEALELAERLAESLAAGDTAYLARRFLAITQHNMIEEARDVFPLAAKFND